MQEKLQVDKYLNTNAIGAAHSGNADGYREPLTEIFC